MLLLLLLLLLLMLPSVEPSSLLLLPLLFVRDVSPPTPPVSPPTFVEVGWGTSRLHIRWEGGIVWKGMDSMIKVCSIWYTLCTV